MIAVFRPTRAGDTDAVLRCVRLLRAVQEQRAYCPTGKGGGVDNSCPTNKGSGGTAAEGGSGGSGGSRYREAKTKEEAESVARQYANSVSLRGVDVASANKINKQLDDFFQDHPDVPPLYSIEAKKFNGSGGMREDAAAAYDMVNNRLFINTAKMGSEKKWQEHLAAAASARKTVEDAVASKRLSPDLQAKAERLLSGRALVDPSFSGAVIHEMGHHFDSTVLMRQEKSSRAALMERRGQYQDNLSTYAGKDAYEYFAESYVAYRLGRDIDPELKAVFDKRKGRK